MQKFGLSGTSRSQRISHAWLLVHIPGRQPEWFICKKLDTLSLSAHIVSDVKWGLHLVTFELIPEFCHSQNSTHDWHLYIFMITFREWRRGGGGITSSVDHRGTKSQGEKMSERLYNSTKSWWERGKWATSRCVGHEDYLAQSGI